MRYPALNDLIEETGDKYSLVIVTAKRSRQIVEANINDDSHIINPVSLAAKEIAMGKVEFLKTTQQ
ncbi:MAG TPA: DNA-directed RNA polymerase subunit omega [Eubacteriaceae bacterium]|nr:DNA-directed RNA polymerase subunit omega [Eubacteriaceae bacterium]